MGLVKILAFDEAKSFDPRQFPRLQQAANAALTSSCKETIWEAQAHAAQSGIFAELLNRFE